MVSYTGFYFYQVYDFDNKKISKMFITKENATQYCKDNKINNYFIKTVSF